MALLADSDRNDASLELQRELSAERVPLSAGRTKADVRTLINVCDNFLDGERLTFRNNYMIPGGVAAGDFTAQEIARAMIFVIKKRFLRGA